MIGSGAQMSSIHGYMASLNPYFMPLGNGNGFLSLLTFSQSVSRRTVCNYQFQPGNDPIWINAEQDIREYFIPVGINLDIQFTSLSAHDRVLSYLIRIPLIYNLLVTSARLLFNLDASGKNRS